MLKLLRRLFNRPRPLTDAQRVALYVTMSERMNRRLRRLPVEPISELINRELQKGSD